MLLSAGDGCLPEDGRNLVKSPAPGLGDLEEGENEEEEQQQGEDDEHVGAAQLL